MSALRLRTIATAMAAVGVPAGAWYAYQRSSETTSAQKTFDLRVRVRGPDGRPTTTTKTLSQLDKKQVDEALRAHAVTQSVRRPGGIRASS